MGVDLTLYPLHPQQLVAPLPIQPFTVLGLDRNRWLWMLIEEQTKANPLGRGIYVPWPDPGEGPFDPVDEDPYGQALTTVSAGELVALTPSAHMWPVVEFAGEDTPEPPWRRNEEHLAFLAALPADRRVVLWWH